MTTFNNSDKIKILTKINTGNNVFLFGPGGTGKSYMIKEIYKYYENKKNIAVIAPTGNAALNLELNGQTINRFFKIPPIDTDKISTSEILKEINNISKKKNKNLDNLDLIIIDEISMVGSCLLFMMDRLLQLKFKNNKVMGGIQIVLSGDFYQLPPVKDDWCFKLNIWDKLNLITFVFEEGKRYDNIETFNFMLRLRKGNVTENDIELLNQRKKAYELEEYKNKYEIEPIRLYSTNLKANSYNEKNMRKIKSRIYKYRKVDEEEFHLVDIATGISNKNIDSKYDKVLKYLKVEAEQVKNDICPEIIYLKVGAKVMFCRNYDPDEGLVNGLIVKVINLSQDYVVVLDSNNKEHVVRPKKFTVKTKNYTVSRTQIPLKPAWAITIHKSQGLTLDSAIIDISDIHQPGQVYVALSRVKNIEDLYIENELYRNYIYADIDILRKFT